MLNTEGTGALRSIFVVSPDATIKYVNPRYDIHKPWHFEAIFDALK